MSDLKGKHEIEAALASDMQQVSSGLLKEDNPLDISETFRVFCEACRRGDLKVCQEKIQDGVNINARDRFDYTPLILASLCGHYEVCQLLLESGALCERDTFQGERCLYNALNDRIRNLLLSYNFSKWTDPLQPLAAHITSLLTRDHPRTSDITVEAADKNFELHKFLLSARSPYFAKKLHTAPDTTTWRLPQHIPTRSFEIAIRYLYLQEAAADLGEGEAADAVLTGIDKISKQLEIDRLFESILEQDNRRLMRQRRTDEVKRGQEQLESWFRGNILRHKTVVDTEKAGSVRWDRNNGIFADVLLQADEEDDEGDGEDHPTQNGNSATERLSSNLSPNGIPVGPLQKSRSPSRTRKPRKSTLYPAHRAMLTRSEFFLAMFASSFREAQETPHLQIIPIACSPPVLEAVLSFLYTERADFGLDIALDVLHAADMLFIEKLKVKAAMIISTLGNGAASIVEAENPRGETEIEEAINVYDVIRAGWDLRVPRLEEFGARYIAYRLERYIDHDEFELLVKESAGRIKERQETDTVELIDDIRYYLSERFRLRFEDAGLEELMDDEEAALVAEASLKDAEGTTADAPVPEDEGVDVSSGKHTPPKEEVGQIEDVFASGAVRTLDGDIAGDEFEEDAMNYQILLGKIDGLLDRLKLDA